MSNLLMDDFPLVLIRKLAYCVGLNEALVLQQIFYMQQNSYAAKEGSRRLVDGQWWVKVSIRDWADDMFYFWDPGVIKRAIYNLEEDGLLVSRNDLNPTPYDQTKWYLVSDAAKDLDTPVQRVMVKNDKRKQASHSRRQADVVPLVHNDTMDCTQTPLVQNEPIRLVQNEPMILSKDKKESESTTDKGLHPGASKGGEKAEQDPQPEPAAQSLTEASQVFYALFDQAHALSYRASYTGPRVELADDPDLVALVAGKWTMEDTKLLLADAMALHREQIRKPVASWPSYKQAIVQVLGERAKQLEDRARVRTFTLNMVETMAQHGIKTSAEEIAWSDKATREILAAQAAGIPLDPDTLNYALGQWDDDVKGEAFSPVKALRWLITVCKNREVNEAKARAKQAKGGNGKPAGGKTNGTNGAKGANGKAGSNGSYSGTGYRNGNGNGRQIDWHAEAAKYEQHNEYLERRRREIAGEQLALGAEPNVDADTDEIPY